MGQEQVQGGCEGLDRGPKDGPRMASVGIDLPPRWPNGHLGLDSRPDRGVQPKHGWWAPVAQCHK
jgi:hypothetical protein